MWSNMLCGMSHPFMDILSQVIKQLCLWIRVKSHTVISPGTLKREFCGGIWSSWAFSLEPTTPVEPLDSYFLFWVNLLPSTLGHAYSIVSFSCQEPGSSHCHGDPFQHDPCLRKLTDLLCAHLHAGNPFSSLQAQHSWHCQEPLRGNCLHISRSQELER